MKFGKEKIFGNSIFRFFLIIVIIMFGFNYCNPFNKTFNNSKYYKNNVEQGGNNRLIPDSIEKNLPHFDNKKGNIKKETSAYFTRYPSIRYHVRGNETLQQIAYRLHISIEELKRFNPNLEGAKPSQPIAPDDIVNVPENVKPSGFQQEVIRLTNLERRKANLPEFKSDDSALNKSAQAKTTDMSVKNYFDHNSPTYGSPFEQMRTFGISYSYAAENIAKGQKNPTEVLESWMKSPCHRANILNPKLQTTIGVGYEANGLLWTQQFIGK